MSKPVDIQELEKEYIQLKTLFQFFLDTKVDGTSQFSPPLVERAVIPFVPTMTNVPLPNTIP